MSRRDRAAAHAVISVHCGITSGIALLNSLNAFSRLAFSSGLLPHPGADKPRLPAIIII